MGNDFSNRYADVDKLFKRTLYTCIEVNNQ